MAEPVIECIKGDITQQADVAAVVNAANAQLMPGGGVAGAIARSEANLAAIEEFVAANDWIEFLAAEPDQRSNTSVCLSVDLAPEKVKAMVAMLADEGVAHDIGAYRDAPPGLRIWCGATVEESDIRLMLPWLAWAFEQVNQE